MASTRKTDYYNLSQFDDDDKPSWRGDYNGDMKRLDSGLHVVDMRSSDNQGRINDINKAVETVGKATEKAQATADGAKTQADTATAKADDLKSILDGGSLTTPQDAQAMRDEIKSKANASDVYSRNASDARFATKTEVQAKEDKGVAYTKTESDQRFAPIAADKDQTEIVFVGDSYINGVGVSGGYANGMAKVAANLLGLRDHNYAVNGSGYVTGGDDNRPFAQQLQIAGQDTSYDHDKVRYVVIGGGRNDGGQPFNGYATTMETTIRTALNLFPKSKVVAIPGMWDNSMPDTGYARKLGDLCHMGNLSQRATVVQGAYTWGFGEGAEKFSDIHPANAMSQRYGSYIADCCDKMASSYFIDKQWRSETVDGSGFSNASLTVAVNQGTVSVRVRGQQNSGSSSPGRMITLPNLSVMGVFMDTFGYDDGQSTAPLLQWNGRTASCVGNIFGTPAANRVVNAWWSYSMLGNV